MKELKEFITEFKNPVKKQILCKLKVGDKLYMGIAIEKGGRQSDAIIGIATVTYINENPYYTDLRVVFDDPENEKKVYYSNNLVIKADDLSDAVDGWGDGYSNRVIVGTADNLVVDEVSSVQQYETEPIRVYSTDEAEFKKLCKQYLKYSKYEYEDI